MSFIGPRPAGFNEFPNYEDWQYRKLSVKEKKYFNTLCKGSALRYLLTRVYDYSNTPNNAIIKIKDPKEYIQKLIFHSKMKKFNDYIN